MNLKSFFLFCLSWISFVMTADGQMTAPNVDFETGTNAVWTYYRGTNTLVGSTAVWTMTTCAPVPTLHDITNIGGTDPFGGFSTVGDGIHSIKLGKDSANYNADGCSYNLHVPATGKYSVVYRYALVFEDPSHSLSNNPRFEVSVTDSATGAPHPCTSFTIVSSTVLPGFSRSTVGSRPYYSGWTAKTLDLSGMAGKTVTISFKVGGCTQSGHWGYAYVDMNAGLYAVDVTGCSGGTATLTARPGDSLYAWTDSATYTASYGTTRSVVITTPTITTTYAVILTPYAGFGCPDTMYARVRPSTFVPHPARDTAICAGATVKLWSGATDVLPLTYAWSPTSGLSCTTCDTTFATPPTGLTSYKVTTTTAGGCSHTDTIDVTTYPIPSAIGGVLSVCVGTTTTLSNTASGGRWTTSATTVSVGSTSGVVTGLSLGTANITYSFSGLCPVFATVTVQAAPTITGVPTACVGFTTSLSSTSAPGTWSSSNTSVATVSTGGTVTGVATGTARITFTATSSSCRAIQIVTVVPLPSPISGTGTICQYATTSLMSSSGGVWSSGNTTVASVGSSTGDVYGVGAGTATISYSFGTGCAVTKVMTVLLSPLPIAGTLSMCVGGTTVLSNGISGGSWTSSDPTVATVGSSTGLVTGIGPVTARISYSLPSGCRAMTTVTVNPLPNPITGPSSVCIGLTITLSDASPGGSWASSNTAVATIGSTSGVVLGVGAGSSVITYALTTGCFITKTVTISSSVTPILGVTSVCAGSTTCLSNATSGGTWASSALPVASIGSSTGCVAGISAGTTTITYKLASGCITTAVATVNPLPPAITGSSSVCVGSTTTLSNSSGPGTWASSNTAVATIGTSGIVSGVGAGSSSITYTLGTGCFITTVITAVAPPASITGTGNICTGATTTLSNVTPGGSWSSSDITVATVGSSSGIVTAIAAGTASISYAVGTACSGATTTITVSPMPAAIGGLPATLVGLTTTLSDAVTGGTWSSSDITIATVGSSSGIVTGVGAGTATITYTIDMICTATITVTVAPVPLEAAINGMKHAGSINISPNPSAGTINIEWQNQPTENATIVIADVTGREIYKSVLNIGAATGNQQVDLIGLSNGVYMITIRSERINYSGKLQVLK